MVRRLVAHDKVVDPFYRYPVVSEAIPQLIHERLRVGPEYHLLAGRIAAKRKVARRIDFPDRLLHEVATFRTTRREIQRWQNLASPVSMSTLIVPILATSASPVLRSYLHVVLLIAIFPWLPIKGFWWDTVFVVILAMLMLWWFIVLPWLKRVSNATGNGHSSANKSAANGVE